MGYDHRGELRAVWEHTMTLARAAARLPRTQAVADAIAKWMDCSAKKPKKQYGRKWCTPQRPKPKEIK